MKVSAAHTAGDFEIGLAGGIANIALRFQQKIAGVTQRAIRNKQPTLAKVWLTGLMSGEVFGTLTDALSRLSTHSRAFP